MVLGEWRTGGEGDCAAENRNVRGLASWKQVHFGQWNKSGELWERRRPFAD